MPMDSRLNLLSNTNLFCLQLLLAVGTKLEHVITQLAHEVAEKHSAIEGDLVVNPSDEHFWFGRPKVILYLIHFILFQNAFEIAFFFWILVSVMELYKPQSRKEIKELKLSASYDEWYLLLFLWKTTYGFNSCIMDHVPFILTRLIIGYFILFLAFCLSIPFWTSKCHKVWLIFTLQGHRSNPLQLQYLAYICNCHTGVSILAMTTALFIHHQLSYWQQKNWDTFVFFLLFSMQRWAPFSRRRSSTSMCSRALLVGRRRPRRGKGWRRATAPWLELDQQMGHHSHLPFYKWWGEPPLARKAAAMAVTCALISSGPEAVCVCDLLTVEKCSVAVHPETAISCAVSYVLFVLLYYCTLADSSLHGNSQEESCMILLLVASRRWRYSVIGCLLPLIDTHVVEF